jgi:homoserine kinase
MSIDLRVPATLSNLGPGFDVLGMAIDLYNEFSFESAQGWWDGDSSVDPEEHLCFRTILRAQAAFGGDMHGLRLRQTERVPRSRGLGSSATARIAGFEAWRRLTGTDVSTAAALSFLSQEEGHPDNVVAAMLGGWTVCVPDEGPFTWRRFEPPEGLRIAVCVPSVEVSTDAARSILPSGLSRDDAVYNLRRLSLLMAGLFTGDAAALRAGVRDRLHHRFRAHLIGPVDDAIAAAEAAGAAAAFISGSGSTLGAFVLDSLVEPNDVAAAMASVFAAQGVEATCLSVAPATVGATVR